MSDEISASDAWRAVAGFEGIYAVSAYGEVYSYRLGRRLKPYLVKGYPSVSLRLRGNRALARVHRMVAEAFHGSPAAGLECAHLDGNPQNNRADNLAWVTRSENEHHKIAHGTAHKRSPAAKLTDAQVDTIRGVVGRLTRQEIATLAGVSLSAVYDILNGKHYRASCTVSAIR